MRNSCPCENDVCKEGGCHEEREIVTHVTLAAHRDLAVEKLAWDCKTQSAALAWHECHGDIEPGYAVQNSRSSGANG